MCPQHHAEGVLCGTDPGLIKGPGSREVALHSLALERREAEKGAEKTVLLDTRGALRQVEDGVFSQVNDETWESRICKHRLSIMSELRPCN